MTENRTNRELDYDQKKEELIQFLRAKDNAIMALATAQADRVLVRTILVTCQDLDVFFFTWGHSRKCEQIRANPRVALCKDGVQIEGQAEIMGGLFDERNREYLDLFKRDFPDAIENWRDRPGMVLVKVTVTAAVIAGGSPGEEPHLQFLDFARQTAHAEPWAHY